jgi:hypothetical protein
MGGGEAESKSPERDGNKMGGRKFSAKLRAPWRLAVKEKMERSYLERGDNPMTRDRFLGCSHYPNMMMFLEPNAEHHAVTFSGRTEKWRILPPTDWELPRDKMWMFQAVDGAEYSKALFPSFHLPDGRLVHYYHKARRLVDEVPAEWIKIVPPTSLEDIFQDSLPSLDVLKAAIQTVVIEPLEEDEDNDPETTLTFAGEVPRAKRHSLLTNVKHKCNKAFIQGCPAHGIIEPPPFTLVAQLTKLTVVSNPPEVNEEV